MNSIHTIIAFNQKFTHRENNTEAASQMCFLDGWFRFLIQR